jgi:hypothetical protein
VIIAMMPTISFESQRCATGCQNPVRGIANQVRIADCRE